MKPIKWRNLTITNVDWFKKEIEYEFDTVKSHFSEKFTTIWNSIDSTDELQAIKMIMDRIIVKWFSTPYFNCLNSTTIPETQDAIYKYIVDIFKHPYEWNATLIEEEGEQNEI